MEKLVLIDGNSLINRAFYAMPILTTKDGTPTNAVYGFMNMFFKMMADISPKYVAVAFDLKAPTFRHKIYADYKGTRKPMPDELRPQIPLLKELLKLMGVCVLEKEGSEADDIIGTIAKSTDIKTIIFTGDKDSFQLVDQNTEVHFTKRGISDTDIYNFNNFTQKTGINPVQIIDLKALMGDSSDNIPGVSGVGEKTALTLVQTYKSIDNLYAHTDQLKGKLQEKIILGKESAYLSKTLATIDINVDIDTNLQNMAFSLPVPSAVRDKFYQLEFKSLALKTELFATQENLSSAPAKTTSIQVEKVQDLEKLQSALKPNSKYFISITDNSVNIFDGQTEYEISVLATLLDDGWHLGEILNCIKNLFDTNNQLVVYSKKDFLHLLYTNGLPLNAFTEDLSILKYLVDFSNSNTLQETILEYGFDIKAPAFALAEIYNLLVGKLDEATKKLYYDVELPLANVLFDMELAGFKIDALALSQTGEKYKQILLDLDNQIKALCDSPNLNINSPKQLGEVLFEKLKIGKGKKTKTGYSTSAEVLESFEASHPVIPLILKHRKVQKLLSTYIDGFKPLIDVKSGLIHTSFNQTVTATGRLSSKEPNLQNIPVRDDEGKELRKFFVPRNPDGIIITADYSQIELRLLADFSNCTGLIKAFEDGKDIHTATASKVFNQPIEKVTSHMRSSAKAVNFGIIYGISEYGLAKNLKISPAEARGYIQAYFNEYPEVKQYMNKNVDFAKQNGYSVTLLGRKRFIPELTSNSFNIRAFGERVAMNMPLQGSSADIIKLAMLGVANRLKRENLQSKLILQVHDELIIDAVKSEEQQIKKILTEEMEGAVQLKVKLTVSCGSGTTWFDAK